MTQQTDNVVDFKKVKADKEYQRLKELIEENFDRIFEESLFIDEISFFTIGDIVEGIGQHGYDVNDNPESIKDVMLLIKVLRGLLYRCKGQSIEEQKISDAIFAEMKDPQKELDKFLDLYYYEPPSV